MIKKEVIYELLFPPRNSSWPLCQSKIISNARKEERDLNLLLLSLGCEILEEEKNDHVMLFYWNTFILVGFQKLRQYLLVEKGQVVLCT